jgi:hypothetical protein
MLALAGGVEYIHEPFNPLTPPGVSGAPFDHFYTYITDENARPYLDGLQRTLSFQFNWGPELRQIRGPRSAVRSLQAAASFHRGRRHRARPLLKDPIALLSAEWLADRFDLDVVLVVRSPLGFAASLKRLGWNHPFDFWAADASRMKVVLDGFETEVRTYAETPPDIVSQAILLWRILNCTVHRLHDAHPEWSLVRHEDLSRDPLGGFRALYTALGLEWTTAVAAAILAHTATGNPPEVREAHGIRADSARNVEAWRHRLTEDEVRRIRAGTADVARLFYDGW